MKEVKLSELKSLVDQGKKRSEIASHYELTESQTAKMLKEAGLQIKKSIPGYVLIDDEKQQPDQYENTTEEKENF